MQKKRKPTDEITLRSHAPIDQFVRMALSGRQGLVDTSLPNASIIRAMSISFFLAGLFENGRVKVAETEAVSRQEFSAIDRQLHDEEARWRLDLPGSPPAFAMPAGRWAATRLYRACQFMIFRDWPQEKMADAFAEPCPANSADPATHYSVDVVFRFLPDLHRFARTAAENDPLVATLAEWGRDWPLSSVGMTGVVPGSIDGFIGDRSLRQLYADRIIARNDHYRLADPRVRAAVDASIGLFPELSPILEAHP